MPLAVKAANEEVLDMELVDTEVAIGRRRAGGAAEAASVEIADTELVDTEVATECRCSRGAGIFPTLESSSLSSRLTRGRNGTGLKVKTSMSESD